MNANDLADRLEQFYSGTHITKAAEILRQQELEIMRLNERIHALESEIFNGSVK